MQHIFLINKKSRGVYFDLENKLYKLCKNENMDFKIVITEHINTMKEYARNYKNQNAIVYAIGGDGTLNIVLNELVGGKAKLGILPFGTGNDFYRALSEYTSDTLDVNVMNVNGKFGLNAFSLGIDAEICTNVEKLKKLPLPTNYLYYISALYTLFQYRNQVIGINDFFEKKTLLAICNGSYYGGGHKIAPRASITTPDVFVVSVEAMSKLKMPFFWLDVLNGVHEDNPYVDLFVSDKEIHIETMHLLNGQLDGEILKNNEFKVIPHASSIEVVNNRRLIRELRK